MTTTMPSRQDIEAADSLTFPDRKPAERDVSICIELAPDGLHVRVDYIGPLKSIPQAIERLRQAGVLELVTPARATPPSAPRKPNTGITPAYDGAGQAMCPVHHKPLSEGRYGPYCPSRAEGEHANAKGYCNIRFAE